MPFHWVIYILRYTYYNSQGFHRGISAGILIAYFIVCISFYFVLGIKNETRHHFAKKIFLIEECDHEHHNDKELHEVYGEISDKNVQLSVTSTTPSGHVVYRIVKEKESSATGLAKKNSTGVEMTTNV
jgi:hypothetical protein